MKTLTYLLLASLLTFCSCERKPVLTTQAQKHETPKPLQNDSKDISLISKRMPDENLVEAIYADMIKDNADLKGLELPVRVSGTFDNLKYKLEFGQMLSGMGKEQVKVLKDTAKDALKGQLDDLKKQLREGSDKSSAQGQGATSGTATAPEAKRPEEKLKDKLKGLLR